MSETVLVIYDSVLFERGHMVRRWAEAVERRYTENAIAFAPVNRRANKSNWDTAYPPGSLKASISGDVDRIGPKHLQTIIRVDVPYAMYVIGGTSTITPSSSSHLRLPFNSGFVRERSLTQAFGRPTYHRWVRGQAGNNFMLRAHAATAARHPSLRGFDGQVFQQH